MRIAGIIAEYNPLHNGHIYHMEQARAQAKAEACIVILSGNFVQRGEPACTDKLTRTEWALKAGADIVLELPSIYATANAERFAIGAVRTLAATGVITDLAFGSEESDLRILLGLSDVLTTEPPEFINKLHEYLKMGLSYPRAQYAALKSLGMPDTMTDALAKPNNILAIEYLRAMKRYAPNMRPLPITRSDTGYHTTELTGEFSSATAIRKALLAGDGAVLSALPSFVGGPLLYDSQFPITQDQFGPMILSALRRLSLEELKEIPDIGEGLENVIYRAVRSKGTLEEFYEAVKSKRYTLARCKRIAISALLGITASHVHETMRSADGLYLRVLGFRQSARPLLSYMAKNASAPLILRNVDAESAPEIVRKNLAIDSLATDLMGYASGLSLRKDFMAPIIF